MYLQYNTFDLENGICKLTSRNIMFNTFTQCLPSKETWD